MMMRSRASSGGAVGASSSSKSVGCAMMRRTGVSPIVASGGGRGGRGGGGGGGAASSTAVATTTSTVRHQRQLQRQRRGHTHVVVREFDNGGGGAAVKKSQRTLLARCVVTAAEVANNGASADAELPELAPRPVLPGLAAAPVRPVPHRGNGNGSANGNGNKSRKANGNGARPRQSEREGGAAGGGRKGERPKNIAVPPPPRPPSPPPPMAKNMKANRKKSQQQPPSPSPSSMTSTPRATVNKAASSSPRAAAASPVTDTAGQRQSLQEPPKRPVSGKKKKKLDAEAKRALVDAERESRFMQRRGKAATGVVTPEMKRKAREERKKRRAEENAARAAEAPGQVDILEVGPDGLPIENLARLLAIAPTQVVGSLFIRHGVMTTVNQTIDASLVRKVCEEYEVDVLELSEEEAKAAEDAKERQMKEEAKAQDEDEDLEARAPVVCIMGHVDHGKTSLLDYMKKSAIANSEAGGITQGIGAYRVPVPGAEEQVVFLDTPGHEAFSEMRRRGAKMTDIALLIVAADDGVKETTKQAYQFAKSNEVPVVVALTKIDKPGAQPDRVRQELADLGLLCEDWGGQTPTIAISSKSGENVDALLETLLLVAELENLRANPERLAEGVVIEAELDKGRGCVASVLVQAGTLRVGDVIRAGAAHGRVRSLLDDRGRTLKAAGPSMPVQVSGLSAIPLAGDPVAVCKNIKEAEALAKTSPQKEAMAGDLNWARQDFGDLQTINVVVRADNAGSLEAVRSSLGQIPQDKVALRFVSAGNGDVSVSDIDLADTSGSMVIGFNVDVVTAAAAKAKQAGIEVHSFDVIYALIDHVKEQMLSLIDETEELEYMGSATVKAIFQSGRGNKVAGCIVKEGKIDSGCVVKIFRKEPGSKKAEEIVPRDTVGSIRRVKDVVPSVSEGTECGIGLKNFSGFEEGDIIKAYEAVTMPPSLEL